MSSKPGIKKTNNLMANFYLFHPLVLDAIIDIFTLLFLLLVLFDEGLLAFLRLGIGLILLSLPIGCLLIRKKLENCLFL
jgi:hypothetical protein